MSFSVRTSWQAWRRNKRVLIWTISIGLVVLIAGALAWYIASGNVGIPANDPVLQRVRASGKLRVCLDASFPPFESVGENGIITGFDPDLASEIARRMNVQPQYVNTGFDTLYAELAAQHCDAIISAFPFDRLRTQDVAFSDIYFRGGEVLVVRSDDKNMRQLGDASGQKIGVELGTSAEALTQSLERRNGYQVQSFTTLEDAARALENNDVRGVVSDAVSARLLLRVHRGLTIAGEPVGQEPNYVIAMPAEAGALQAAINTLLRAMTKDGTLKRLTDKWF